MKTILAMIAVFAALAVVGQMDYTDAQKEEAHKCAMVAAGAWPAAVARGIDCKEHEHE